MSQPVRLSSPCLVEWQVDRVLGCRDGDLHIGVRLEEEQCTGFHSTVKRDGRADELENTVLHEENASR
jgi:hypothetical protein